MSGLEVVIGATTVKKVDLPGCEGSVARQIRHLQAAQAVGLAIPQLLDFGSGWAKWERVDGPVLAEAKVTPERVQALKTLVSTLEKERKYVGDLHGNNLVWRDGWVVVDCGAARSPREQPIRERLRRKWRNLPQWASAVLSD